MRISDWSSDVCSSDLPATFRVHIGGDDCTQPYSASIFNISAMRFGSLSANAIRALNQGAKLGGFTHDTGEGSISRYHREHGGDLIWELGRGNSTEERGLGTAGESKCRSRWSRDN